MATLVQRNWLPAIRAAVRLAARRPEPGHRIIATGRRRRTRWGHKANPSLFAWRSLFDGFAKYLA
jgi:hypothetical protein